MHLPTSTFPPCLGTHKPLRKMGKNVGHNDMNKSIPGDCDLNPNAIIPKLCCALESPGNFKNNSDAQVISNAN